jgi:predicted heme/steroid binding protein
MSINFEYIKIDELLEDNYNFYRQQKEFTLDQLAQYDGKNGKPAYVAIEGIVYDVSNESAKNIGIIAGKDLTEQLNFYYRMNQFIDIAPKVGVIDNDNNIEYTINKALHEQEKQISHYQRSNQIVDYAELLIEGDMYRRKKKVTKKNYKCQEYIPLDKLVELENVLKKTFSQILELQIEMLKCNGEKTGKGVATGVVETNEVIGQKSSSFGGLAGGAAGGAGGGLGAVSESKENLGEFEEKNEEKEIKLGPGATGGAAGGALGSTRRIISTETTVGSFEDTTE